MVQDHCSTALGILKPWWWPSKSRATDTATCVDSVVDDKLHFAYSACCRVHTVVPVCISTQLLGRPPCSWMHPTGQFARIVYLGTGTASVSLRAPFECGSPKQIR
mmetsp:Transcript_37637/g.100107  ORF Transcript_37637/g.100107 Transcript_37637/m.100107 type:complete len:105 (+) Transcript_37637:1114-1428(+)